MCKKHRAYKAIRQPTSACEPCWRMWFAYEDIARLNAVLNNEHNCTFCTTSKPCVV